MEHNPSFERAVRQLILPVYAPAFLMSMCQGIALLVIPLFALQLDAGAGIAALIFSLRGLGNIAFDIPAGSLASRLGDRFTMILGVGIMLAASLATTAVTSPTELAVCTFFFGGGMATWLIGRLTYITETLTPAHRGRAIATMAGLQRLGAFIGPILAGLVISLYGYAQIFSIMAAIACLALALVLVFAKSSSKPAQHKHESIFVSLPGILRQHAGVFATAGLAMFMLTVIRSCRQLLIPLWGNSLGLEASTIGYIVGASSAVDMCLFPLAGYVMDRFGRKPAAISCLFFLTLGVSLIPFATSAPTLLMTAMIVGFGNGLGSGINMTLGADLSPEANRGEFIGVWRLMGDTGSFGGPIAIGLLIESISLAASFAVLGLAGFAGVIILVTLVRETRPPQR